MLKERSRSERIVSRCRSSADASTGVASSRRSRSIESSAASSIRLIPESDCTGPSWRKSASRRRSSCSAVTAGRRAARARPRAPSPRPAGARSRPRGRQSPRAASRGPAPRGRAAARAAAGAPDRLLADPQRQDDRVRRGPLTVAQQRRLRAEQLLRLAPRALEHLVGLERAGDRPHRLDQRVEEAGLRRELLLDDLVPAPLADDQVEREGGGADDRRPEPGEREPGGAEREAEQRDDRSRRATRRDQQRAPSR